MSRLQADNFRLYINQVFSESDEAFVQVGNLPYVYDDSTNKEILLYVSLYKPVNQQDFVKSLMQQGDGVSINDSLVSASQLVKNWTVNHPLNARWGENNISLGNLTKGIYIVEMICQNDVARVPVLISNYALVTQRHGKSILAYVADNESGKQDKNFDLYYWKANELVEADANENGLHIFNDVSKSGNKNQFLAVNDEDFTLSDFYYYNYSDDESKTGIVFTDRPAYRPGQELFFQGIIRNKSGYELSVFSDTVTVIIENSQGEEIYKKELITDDNGSFNDSISIGENYALGNYNITVLTDKEDRWNYYSQVQGSFIVEEYKKPEYEVNVTLDQPRYVSGDTVKAKVNATYFFGAPVKNATVMYRVMRERYYVPWYMRYGYSWWYEDDDIGYSRNAEELYSKSGKINEDGTFEIAVPTDAETNENYRYRIQAQVTDASRRTINGNAAVLVTATSFTINVNSEKFYYKTDEDVLIRVSTADFSENPVSKEFELVASTYRYSRDGEYEDNEEIYKTTGKTDEKSGIATVEFPLKKPGYYQVKVTSTDVNGKSTSETTSVYILEEGSSSYSWWNNESAEVQLLTDKKVYNAGDTINAMVLAPSATDALFSANGAETTFKGIYQFNENGTSFKEFTIPVGKDVYGQMAISLAYVAKGKLYTRSENVTVIPEEKYLDVAINFDEKQYKPATKAEATILVTDKNGKPVKDALVSLNTADESIYFLYPDKTEDIRKAFYPNKRGVYVQFYNNAYGKSDNSNLLSYDYLIDLIKSERLKPDKDFFVSEGMLYYLNPGDLRDDSHRVHGYVVDENGNLLSGVKIKSGKQTVKTNEWGYYEMFNPEDTILTFSYKKAKITFTDIHFFKGNNDWGYRDILLNTRLNQAKKNDNEISLNNPNYFGRREPMMFADSAGDGDWGSEALSAEEDAVMEVAAASSQKIPIQRRKVGAPANVEVTPVVRENFKDAIYWNPTVKTDENGEAKVTITLPDNLTTWRTTAKVITKDSKVGQSLAKIVVKKDLLIRMETPRFIQTGDKLLIATNVHNYLSRRKSIRVVLKADGLEVSGTSKTITVAANDEARVDWEVDANWPLDAVITAEAITNEESDAKKVTVPVQPTGLEMVKGYSSVLNKEKSGDIELIIPEDVDLNTVKLELSAAPSVAAALLSSLDQLIGYPYGCVEQTMSRFLPTLIVSNTLQQLKGSYTSNISAEEMQKMTAQGLQRLKELQHNDGGWGWWENDDTHPFMTAYVVNGLALAKKTGYEVPDYMLEEGKNALAYSMKNKGKVDTTTYAYQAVSAMQAGLVDIWKELAVPTADSLDAYQAALWLQAAQIAGDNEVVNDMLHQLEKTAVKDGNRCHWGAQKFYYSWQEDQVETTANAVKALAAVNPEHELIAPAVQWLMQKRRGNGWHNTRQTAFIVLGLQDVIASELKPDYELVINTNGKKVLSEELKSEDVFEKAKSVELRGENFLSSKAKQITNPLGVLQHGKNTININKLGNGTAYVNATLTYFLQKESKEIAEAKNENLIMTREYYVLSRGFDKNEKVVYKKEKIKEGAVPSGSDILVKVKIESNESLDYVLIEDPIPAGFEFIKDKTGYNIEDEKAYSNGNYYSYYYRWMYYAHEEYRDNRYAIVLTRLGKGEYEYSYLMKAQIPGVFEVNPAVVQLMYYPEKRAFTDFEKITILRPEKE